MYKVTIEQHFDAAHFLAGYQGKCHNLHGHRWRVLVTVGSKELQQDEQQRGMVEDFKVLKAKLKDIVEMYDHALIYEQGSLQPKTIEALQEEDFRLVEVTFRPTAENFAHDFFVRLQKDYQVTQVTVYETPDNCAVYEGDDDND